jgi:hypothetical protein
MWDTLPQHERRMQTILALFRGEAVGAVSAQYRICRSDLYKHRQRALTAISQALVDHRRGPRRPSNRLAEASEQEVVALCQRHPTWSSYTVHAHCTQRAPSPRTI